MTAIGNFDISRGDSKTLNIAVNKEDGTSFDLSGATVRFWVMMNAHSSGDEVLITKSNEANGGITAIAGGVAVNLTRRDMDIPAGLYALDLKVFKGADVATSMQGTLFVHHAARMPATPTLHASEFAVGSPVFDTPLVTIV